MAADSIWLVGALGYLAGAAALVSGESAGWSGTRVEQSAGQSVECPDEHGGDVGEEGRIVKAFHVVQWEAHEKADSRKTDGGLLWYASPAKHDGLGWAYLTSEEDRESLYGTWKAILDVASRGARGARWWLVRGGRALTAKDLAAMTKFRVQCFERAFEFFCRPEVGWLEQADFRAVAGENGTAAGVVPKVSGEVREGVGTNPATDRQTDKETDKQSTDQKKDGVAALKMQWAALNDQVKRLEGVPREQRTGEQRRELREKKAARDAVQKKQAEGRFE